MKIGPKGLGLEELGRCTRGSVFVEFLGSFMVMFCFFLFVWQYSYLQIASIFVKHAAVQTARAAIIVLHDDPAKYDGVPKGEFDGKRKEEIYRAANMVVKPLKGKPQDLKLLGMKSNYGRDDLVEINLEFHYSCFIPFARYIMCSDNPDHDNPPPGVWSMAFVDKRKLTGYAALPNQGADFEY